MGPRLPLSRLRSALIVEREAPGGQAGTSERIRNYMGVPSGMSGSDLAIKAMRQSWLSGSEIDHIREVVKLEVVDGPNGSSYSSH